MGTYLEPASITIVKEFYANAVIEQGECPTYIRYVRGKTIPFDVDTIDSFLGIDDVFGGR